MKSICYDKKTRTPKINLVEDSNPEYNQTILNIILDKISSKGIDSLNDKEKDFLSKYSG